ncbi:MAG: transcription termination/antitermination protein NusG [Candidatus Shapirobacteria bacterium]|nr:transcription termination/antitermination protein NusG [Candidatus Shapirobacteria bacterium]MDD5073886.1 transcription termination/antitermination protein NusG [Candidatus Shapirobacteria bacterium]MDD5481479.1 transcription termination/antitermination protein NusG [Candidatus Shapirobacteria bacterium]
MVKNTDSNQVKNHWVITEGDHPQAKWYILHTYSGQESRVAKILQQRIQALKIEGNFFEILIPTEERMKIRAGKRFTKEEMLFPGYVFVRMVLDDNSWAAARGSEGVTGFVGSGDQPSPVAEREIRAIEKYLATEKPKYTVKLTVGEAVKIVDGPFAGFLGTIDNIDKERGKLRVMVSVFGRETPVELDFLQAKKA